MVCRTQIQYVYTAIRLRSRQSRWIWSEQQGGDVDTINT